jgi:CysZ protein|tara:strand:+ start:586 stop:1275 length:690 start_codon:yes stop_codon:yes gene_type:complete
LISAINRAITQLGDPAFRSVLFKALGLTLVIYILVGFGATQAFSFVPTFDYQWINTAIGILAGLGFLLGGFFLFPLIISALIGIFLDDISDAVERQYYATDPPGKSLSLMDSIWDALKFLALVVGCNILVLPLYFVPVINLFVYYLLNGYLISREYFHMVAIRHHPVEEVTRLRKRNGSELYMMGIVIAFSLTIPIVNLVAPIVATAAMVHLYKKRIGSIAKKRELVVP